MIAVDGTELESRSLPAGIFAAAAGVLLLEVALTRIFSFTIWYHFAYLTISVALLGFASAGSFLAAFPRLLADPPKLLQWACLVAQAGVALILLIASAVPLDPVTILHDGQHYRYLLVYYVAVAVPFLGAGLAIAGAIASAPARVARLYFWDLVGAGVGCCAVVPLIWWLGTPVTAALASAAFGVGSVAFSRRGSTRGMSLAAVLAILTITVGATVEFTPGPHKFISIDTATGAQPIFHSWTPINRVDAVAWDETTQDDRTGTRNWGASKRYDGPGQHFRMIGYDGDSCTSMYRYDGDRAELEWLQHHVLKTPYVLVQHPEVLVIGVGGGTDILNAVTNDAAHIVGVELNPVTIELGKSTYAQYNGGIFNRPDVTMVAAEGRQFLRSHADRYDLIEINGVNTLSALSSAAYVLPESYLYTSDAVGDYLAHLKASGVFAMAVGDFNTPRWLPRHTLRLLSNARRALLANGVEHPERHIVVIASREGLAMTHTLIKNEPFSAEEIAKLDAFAQAEDFVFWQRPDRRVDHAAALLLWADDTEREAFYAAQDLNVRATTDESPFFFNFYKWSSLRERSSELDAGRTFTTGQIVLALMLAQSIVFASLLILAPLLRLRRGVEPLPRRIGYVLYFGAVGLGFILLEISFVQRFVLYLGYPTYALSVVLFSLLSFAGIGSHLSARLARRDARVLPSLLAVLVTIAAVYLLGLQPIFRATLGAALPVRIAITVVLLAPLGLVLGTFFPLGIALVTAASRQFVPWAWAITGCASVVGTILAVIVAMVWDFRAVTLLALTVYGAGVGAMLWARGAHPAPR